VLGEKKEKVPFGQRKSKGSFGSKPSTSGFGSKPSNGSFGKKPSSKPLGSKKATPKTRLLKKDVPEQQERLRTAKPTKSMFEKPQKRIAKKSKKNVVTALEQEFMDWLHSDAVYFDYPCFVCGKFNPCDKIGWHHVKEFSSDKKNHKRQIPLCDKEHHWLGNVLSPHGTPKKWRATYTMKVQNKYADSIWNDFLNYKKNMGA
jgi:hypothetical protein